MKLRSDLLFALAFMMALLNASCNNEGPRVGPGTTPQSGGKFTEGSDYFLFTRVRVMDEKGFDQPAEAYSLLLPKDWSAQTEIIWTGPGSGCDGTNTRLKASSADGRYSLEFFPMYIWSWTGNQQLQQFQQQNPGSSAYCSYGEPMNAEQYLRNGFAPEELGNPEIVSVSESPDAVAQMQASNEKGRQELIRYGASDVRFDQSAVTATLRWADGTAGIALCSISNVETVVPNVYDGSYAKQGTRQAQQRIVFRFPQGEEEQATRMLSVIMSSYRTNPYWSEAVNSFWKNVREQKQVAHIGRIRMMDAQTKAIGEQAIRNGNQRLADMDVELRNWETKQASGDRIHSEFIKTIRGVENYQDASGKVELSSGYDHAWSRGDGSSFLMSNNPNFDPSSVFQDQQWSEMKKVD